MPVDFLTDTQSEQYGRFTGEPTAEQLARSFHFDDADLERISQRRGDHNRLGFALQLGTVRFLGTFLPNPLDVPSGVISYVSRQLNITHAACLPRYMARKQTYHAHRAEIQHVYQYWEFNALRWRFRLSRWLYARAWLSHEQPSHLFDLATHWLIQRKVLLPGMSTLTRLIAHIRDRAALRAWQRLASLPNEDQRHQLEALLTLPEGKRRSRFDQLRQGPRHVSSPSMIAALERYEALRHLGIRELDFSRIPPVWVQSLSRYATTGWAPNIARMPEDRRMATLVAFAYAYTAATLDDALDVFDMLIADIAASAKTLGQKKRLRSLRDLDEAALALAEVCAIVLDDAHPNDEVRIVVLSRIPLEQIAQAIATTYDLARPPEEDYQEEMLTRYHTVRRFLPRVLDTIAFQATPAGSPVLTAVDYVKGLHGRRKPQLDDAPLNVVDAGWKRLVIDTSGHVCQPAYTLCVLERLQDRLRRRDIYVEASERWSDPRAKLLQGAAWAAKRTTICRTLGHSTSADDVVAGLSAALDATYRRVSARFSANDALRIEYKDGKATLTITNLDKLEEPASLIELREQTAALLPRVDLAELLLEIQAKTGFADAFTHVSEAEARAGDLSTSVCAVLLSEACNIGLRAVEQRDHPALGRGRLHWVQQNYLRAETLTPANARLVDYQAVLPLAQQWGGGDVASADGLRFVTPVRTLNAGPNRKYFGADRGITYYNFTSDQYTGFHGIVVPGTLRDSLYLLEGLLEQQTSLNPTEIMTDTAGASDMVFGLFWLLGYQFSPRLADAGEARFWRLDMQADYGTLNHIARHRARIDRIKQHWDDMLRIAGSLKLGTVQASELVRSLLKSERPSSLAQAIIDLGRINKTLYLLNYIDDEGYRRRILTQLNRGEGRHRIARTICHGKRGEIRKAYREGQEDQLGALGLVTNAVVLWNTIYLQAALEHLQSEGMDIDPEDRARLSPLQYKHIHVLGRHSFALADPIASGELRPLNVEGWDDEA
jgi:TnpA family transposase